jgi:hypothetical protein
VEAVIQIALEDAVGNVQKAAIRLGVTDRALQMRRAAKREARQNGSGGAPAADLERAPSMESTRLPPNRLSL